MESKDNLYSIPENTISWLLTSQTPSIRYSTHTNIIQSKLDDDAALKERSLIVNTDYVKAIFADQNAAGFWYSEQHYYGQKFRGSHWSMYLLTELAVPPDHPPMQKGAQFMLKRMEHHEDVAHHKIPSYFNEEMIGFGCYWGNWLRYQITCGNLEHPLVQQVIDFVCRDMHRSSTCPHNADLPCAWGVIRSLHGLALIPEEKRTEKINKAIKTGIYFILDEHDLVRGDYPTRGDVHPIWKKLSFPLFYHTDVLFTLRVLADLQGLKHGKARTALDWLASKQKKDGTWRGASPFKSRTHPFLTTPDTPSCWVTLHALSVLSAANRQMAE